MSFKYSVIGDNTKENREHLEKLGYKFINLSWDGKYIFTSKDKSEAYYANGSGFGHINCIGNPQLFQAVSAMRDDSDELQYFTDGASWLKIPIGYDIASFLYTDWDGDCGLDDINKWHKATLSELQEHFQRV